MKLVPLTAEHATDAVASPPPSTDWQGAATRFHRRTLASVLAFGVRADRAEEVVQAAWSALIAAERGGTLTRIELPGLVLAQARFLALKERERHGLERRLMVASDDLAELAADSRGGPEAELLAKENAQQLLASIERMPESAQRLFRLLYADPKLPHAVAARELGLSLQRVRQISSELKQRVRATLRAEQR
jgi:DNA-directed RNA polymerase specialized sigma24 family protein